MFSAPHNSQEAELGWSNCQGGEISGLADRLHQQQVRVTRRNLLARTSLAVGLMLMVSASWLLWQEPTVSRISCREVYALDVQYVRHELSPEMQARITAHLKACPRCEYHIHAVEEELKQAATAVSSPEMLLSGLISLRGSSH